MIPSVKEIMMTGCSEETANKIHQLFEGKLEPTEVSEKCAKWVAACYNEPSPAEKILCAADDLLGNFGPEAIFDSSGIHVLYSYSNTGDTYAITVVYNHELGRWLITSWGDLVEASDY